MTTVATLPAFPVPARETQVVFTLTGAGANFVRVWVTVAPDGSALAGQLAKSTQNRVVVYQADGGVNQPWRFTPDKGGPYTLIAQEYTKGSGYGGGYQGDPNGAVSETKVGAEVTLSLFIGQRVTQAIGVSPDSATLVMWVWNDTIRRTLLAIHGEDSPAISALTPSPRAKAAMGSVAVVTALAALVDVATATALGSLSSMITGIFLAINGHNPTTAGSVHNAADTDNIVKDSNASTPSPAELPQFVNDALLRMRQHRLNDNGGSVTSPGGTDSAAYHRRSGANRADFVNMPLYKSVGDLDEAYAALADIWRAHEGHRVNLTVHGAADTTNTLTALPPILEVHRQFLAVLAAPSPPTPPAQSVGVMRLISQAGFKES